MSISILILGLVSTIFGILKDYFENKKLSWFGWILVPVTIALGVLGYFQTEKEKIEKLKETRPLLRINQIPMFIGKLNDTLYRVGGSAKNYGDRTAANIKIQLHEIRVTNDTVDFSLPLTGKNPDPIVKNDGMGFGCEYLFDKMKPRQVYLYIRICYSDEEKNFPDTIRRIYILPDPTKPAPMFFELQDSIGLAKFDQGLKDRNYW